MGVSRHLTSYVTFLLPSFSHSADEMTVGIKGISTQQAANSFAEDGRTLKLAEKEI